MTQGPTYVLSGRLLWDNILQQVKYYIFRILFSLSTGLPALYCTVNCTNLHFTFFQSYFHIFFRHRKLVRLASRT